MAISPTTLASWHSLCSSPVYHSCYSSSEWPIQLVKSSLSNRLWLPGSATAVPYLLHVAVATCSPPVVENMLWVEHSLVSHWIQPACPRAAQSSLFLKFNPRTSIKLQSIKYAARMGVFCRMAQFLVMHPPCRFFIAVLNPANLFVALEA